MFAAHLLFRIFRAQRLPLNSRIHRWRYGDNMAQNTIPTHTHTHTYIHTQTKSIDTPTYTHTHTHTLTLTQLHKHTYGLTRL